MIKTKAQHNSKDYFIKCIVDERSKVTTQGLARQFSSTNNNVQFEFVPSVGRSVACIGKKMSVSDAFTCYSLPLGSTYIIVH